MGLFGLMWSCRDIRRALGKREFSAKEGRMAVLGAGLRGVNRGRWRSAVLFGWEGMYVGYD